MAPEEEAVVFVGNKPFMNYIMAVITQFTSGVKRVRIKARGKYISRAVDVAQAVINKYMQDVKIAEINIDSEELTDKEGKQRRVSTIDIVLEKA